MPEGLQQDVEGMGFTEVAVYFKERFHLGDSVETIKKSWQDMAMEQYSSQVLLKPGAESFLRYLKKQGIKTAVASSNSLPLIEAALTGRGVRDCFDVIITACDVKKGKPAPDVYLEAARQLCTEPSACLVFEDIVPGILAGKRRAWKCAPYTINTVNFRKKKKSVCRLLHRVPMHRCWTIHMRSDR